MSLRDVRAGMQYTGLSVVRGQVSPRLSNLLVTGAVLWLLIGLGRGSLDDLFASRYVYQGAIVVILIAVELAPGLAIQRRGALTAVALAVAGTVALNLVWMVVWGNHLRRESATARAQLAALDIARGPGGTRPPSVPRLQARRGHGRRLLRGRGRVRRFAGAHDCGAAPCVRAEPRSRRRGAGTRARGEARARSCGLRGRRTRRRASERSGGRDEARVLDDHADRPGRHGRAESAVSLGSRVPDGRRRRHPRRGAPLRRSLHGRDRGTTRPRREARRSARPRPGPVAFPGRSDRAHADLRGTVGCEAGGSLLHRAGRRAPRLRRPRKRPAARQGRRRG